jgi:hypothetical protein
VRSATMCVNVFATGLAHMKVVKTMDDLVGVDLCLVRRVGSSGLMRGNLHGVRETFCIV